MLIVDLQRGDFATIWRLTHSWFNVHLHQENLTLTVFAMEGNWKACVTCWGFKGEIEKEKKMEEKRMHCARDVRFYVLEIQ